MIEVTELPGGPVVEYQVVTDNDLSRLAAQVNHLLAQGWQPYGSMVAITGEGVPYRVPAAQYLQPMVKRAAPPSVAALFNYETAHQEDAGALADSAAALAQVDETYMHFLAETGRV